MVSRRGSNVSYQIESEENEKLSLLSNVQLRNLLEQLNLNEANTPVISSTKPTHFRSIKRYCSENNIQINDEFLQPFLIQKSPAKTSRRRSAMHLEDTASELDQSSDFLNLPVKSSPMTRKKSVSLTPQTQSSPISRAKMFEGDVNQKYSVHADNAASNTNDEQPAVQHLSTPELTPKNNVKTMFKSSTPTSAMEKQLANVEAPKSLKKQTQVSPVSYSSVASRMRKMDKALPRNPPLRSSTQHRASTENSVFSYSNLKKILKILVAFLIAAIIGSAIYNYIIENDDADLTAMFPDIDTE